MLLFEVLIANAFSSIELGERMFRRVTEVRVNNTLLNRLAAQSQLARLAVTVQLTRLTMQSQLT